MVSYIQLEKDQVLVWKAAWLILSCIIWQCKLSVTIPAPSGDLWFLIGVNSVEYILCFLLASGIEIQPISMLRHRMLKKAKLILKLDLASKATCSLVSPNEMAPVFPFSIEVQWIHAVEHIAIYCLKNKKKDYIHPEYLIFHNSDLTQICIQQWVAYLRRLSKGSRMKCSFCEINELESQEHQWLRQWLF